MENKTAKEKKMGFDPEYMEMVSKSMYKLYKPEDKVKVGLEPSSKEAVYSQSCWTLYRYNSAKRSKTLPPVLIVPSLINRPYIMDLLKGHSIIEALLGAGLDVFLLDWGYPDEGIGHLGISHYVGKFLRRAVRQVKTIAGVSKINLMGQCIGGTMAAMYAAHPDLKKDINKLALLTAPLNFENSGILSKWTNPESFDIEKLTANVGAVVPSDFFHSSFPYLNVRATMGKYKNLLERFDMPDFKTIWQALDIWACDNVPFALQAFRDLIQVMYQQNRFYKGIYMLEGKQVCLKDIDAPTLSVAARDDHVFTENAASAIKESIAASANKLEYHVMPAGHVSLIAAHPVRVETFKIFIDFLTAK